MSILALLQLVVSLLIALQGNPNVSLAVKQRVINTASQVVQVAVTQLGNQQSTIASTTPVVIMPTASSTFNTTSTMATSITQQQAIAIVEKDAGINPSSTQVTITASLNSANNWEVNYAPVQPTCVSGNPCSVISGGNAAYIVDGNTGAILSKLLGQ